MGFVSVAAGIERFETVMAEAGIAAPVLREVPDAPPPSASLALCLLDVAEHREGTDLRQEHVAIRAAYVVAAWAATPADSDQLLVDAAAMVEADEMLELLARPVPVDFWTARGAAARPAFLLGLDVERAWPAGPKPAIHEVVVDAEPWSGREAADQPVASFARED